MATQNSEKFFSYLDSLHTKYETLTEKLSDPETVSNQKLFRDLSRELSNLRPLNERYQQFGDLLQQKKDSEELIEIGDDPELAELAREEIRELETQLENLEAEIKLLMVSDQTDDNRNVFLEIRAGAGGNEASLFAQDLLRMYNRIAERKGWKAQISSNADSSIGGIKEIVVHIKGKEVNKYLQFESGVHRVQRVPATESSGRIHTSTVTVAVMPEVDDVEIEINSKDLRIDTYRASGAGGQHVNKTESAIRITHFPTGIVVACQDESSQHKNKDKAMKMLKSKLYEHEEKKRNEELSSDRKSQVGSGDRSEKIRTYNYPQSRVTDHRIQGRNFSIEQVIDGNMDELVKILHEQHCQQKLEDKFKEIIA